MKDKANWGFGFLIIIASGFVCFLLSVNNPDLGKKELGALENAIMHFVSTVVGLILYLVIELIMKYKYWFAFSLTISLVNCIYGIILFMFE